MGARRVSEASVDDYLRQYGFIFIMGGVAVMVPVSVLMISLAATKIRARPYRPNPVKYDAYECGMETIGGPWQRFNVRYYRFALLFLLFDVEVVFLFPWATQAGTLGWSAFGAVLFFMGAMMIGWAYEWKRGGMEWDESLPTPAAESAEEPADTEAVAA
jgi:NADH-quinone oxidoreductase subunit A